MDWKQKWIDGVLEEIPEGGFRRRLEGELRDHLETQYRALLEGGGAEDEARAEALRLMGEAETLREEYEAAWRRRPEARVWGCLGWLAALFFGGMMLFWAYCLVVILFDTLPNIAVGEKTWAAWLGNGALRFFVGALFFWVPFAAEAALLRQLLGGYRRRGTLIAAGLLATWALSTAALVILCLEIGEYSQYGLLPPTWPERLALFYRDMQDGTPWITPGYHLMSIAGCGALGWIFRRRRGGKEKTAA